MADNNRIIDYEPYGRHIALYCRNHPDKRWSTKNIAPLGCRTIFYCGTMADGKCDGSIPECPCSSDLLEPCPQELGHPWDSNRPAK